MAPAGRSFRVGAHYYSDNGFGPADVYVKIYCGEEALEPSYEAGPIRLEANPLDQQLNDFWRVADVILRPEGGCEVEPILVAGLPDVISSRVAERER